MPNIMLHDDEARMALGRGVAKLAKAVRGTLGPRGMNAIIDRPIGTPIISRDGVSIANEIELEDPFENIGAQVLREVSKQTNEVAGDGTTTATVLADALVQDGLASLVAGANPVELVQGLEIAVQEVIAALRRAATPLRGGKEVRAVAVVAANDEVTGAIVAEALERVGPDGIVDVEFGTTVETRLEVVDGMAFDRGYLSHHMVTDIERMQVVLDNPLILMTDQRLQSPEEVAALQALAVHGKRPLLIIAEEVAPACVMTLLAWRDKGGMPVAAIHPPEYGHWRKAMLEDIAIVTGGRVIARDLGGKLEATELRDLGSARQVRISSNQTIITAGGGDPAAVAARRQQVARQYEMAPENVERDKFQVRIAKLSGGTAMIFAGGATPVEQKRRLHLIEDAINAARAAIAEGVVPGGGMALLRVSDELESVIARTQGSVQQGVRLLQRVLTKPLYHIATNCGLDGAAIVSRAVRAKPGHGLDARTGQFVNLMEAGIIDPVKVSYSAVRNAASVAGLILTTQTLIAKKPETIDPTAGPALGAGAELLGRK
ncbi:molecular chaperone GroEL [Verminephrobacter eiseniae]|uniref:60 kDa chaperonin n=1 Tax=Verminephrobacter eiseniae (strain EF01-2) TaxID=391735 RepID=A1WR49_VEREI|nr:molecular chaperone GroEL [Verminephrobacter eiseniae]ABM60106.1 chaperonin Cpn60/TCP-1 [Verminephrobacter eiseniae EF01-2]MCW5285597.1 molecular chaperone GroEL [Verminephrobacter eiseniae]MCW5303897.1 molecular chaperone GroEL [Verminephrobacter eiseniae]MCW8181826.1 molecular chaperone GroEL [Verminephrobacter eiseniae]MCW8192079.1 molecular chaperone GroEL [Verminephrobacter eiseniae]